MCVVLITITEYVVTPYDVLSCLLLLMALLLALRDGPDWNVSFVLLAAVTILATATRETAALILSLYFAIHHRVILSWPRRARLNIAQLKLLLITLCFVGTYAALRWSFGFDHGAYQDLRLSANLAMLPLLGVATLAAFLVLLVMSAPGDPRLGWFTLAASPYLVAMLVVANTWEVRLWTPVVLVLLVLRALDPQTPLNETAPGTPHRPSL